MANLFETDNAKRKLQSIFPVLDEQGEETTDELPPESGVDQAKKEPYALPNAGGVRTRDRARTSTEFHFTMPKLNVYPQEETEETPADLGYTVVPIGEPGFWGQLRRTLVDQPMKAILSPFSRYVGSFLHPIQGFVTAEILPSMPSLLSPPFMGISRKTIGEDIDPGNTVKQLYDALRQQGLSSWVAYGQAFERAPGLSGLNRFLIEISIDPLNFIGWGIWSKATSIPGRMLNAVDQGFFRVANKPFEIGGKAVGRIDQFLEKAHLVPPTVIAGAKGNIAARAAFQAVRAGISDSTRGVATLYTATKADMAKMMDKVLTRKNLRTAPVYIKELHNQLIAGTATDPRGFARMGAVKDAVLHGKDVDLLYLQAEDIARLNLERAAGFSDTETIERLMQIVGGDEEVAQRWASTFLRNRQQKYVDLATTLGRMKPVAAAVGLRSQVFGAQAPKARIAYIEGVQGAMGALLSGIDRIESAVFRRGLDAWLSRPFAEAYLAFPAYFVQNASEEISRSLLGRASPEPLTKEAFATVVGGNRMITETLLMPEDLGSMVTGTLGYGFAKKGSTVDLDALRQLAEGTARAQGLDEVAIKAAGKGAVRAEQHGILEFQVPFYGTVRVGRTSAAKPMFAWTPTAAPGMPGKWTMLPRGTAGDWFGRKWIDLSQNLVTLRRGFWGHRFYSEYSAAVERIGGSEALAPLHASISNAPRALSGLKELDRFKKSMRVLAEAGNIDGIKNIANPLTRSAINKHAGLELLTRYPDIGLTSRAVIRDAVESGDWAQMEKAFRAQPGLAKLDVMQHPIIMARGVTEFETALDAMKITTKADAMNAASVYSNLVEETSLFPSQMFKSAADQAFTLGWWGEQSIAERAALWRAVDENVKFYNTMITPKLRRIAGTLKTKASNVGVNVDDMMSRWERMVTRTDDTWNAWTTWKDEHFAAKVPHDAAFWSELGHEGNIIWGEFHAFQAEEMGGLAASMRNAAAAKRIRMTAINASGRDLSITDVATIMGGHADDLSRAVVKNLAFMDKNGFVGFVRGFVENSTTRHIGVTDAKLEKVYKQLLAEHGRTTASSLLAERMKDIKSLKADMMALRIAPPVTEEMAVDLAKWVDNVVAEAKKIPPEFKPKLKLAQEEAGQRATQQMHREFVNYDNPKYIDQFFKHFMPFWLYESRRWFSWLPQHAIQYPWLPNHLNSYFNATDQGYLTTPWGFEWNPLRGMILANVFTLMKPNYKEAYAGTFFDTVDFWQRRGFYPGFPFAVMIDTIGLLKEGHSEYGELLPSPISSLFDIAEIVGIPGVMQMHEILFPSRFRDYNINQLLEAQYDTRLSDVELELKDIEATPNPTQEMLDRADQLHGMLDSVKRQVAKYDLLAQQTGATRLRPAERRELDVLRPQVLSKLLGITEAQYTAMENSGINPLDALSYKLTPEMRKLLYSMSVTKYSGIGRELSIAQPVGTIIKRQNEYRFELDKVREWYYGAVSAIDRQFVGGKLTPQVRADQLKELAAIKQFKMEALMGKYEYKDGKRVLVEPGKYTWNVQNGVYKGGIPLTDEESRQYAEMTGRADIPPLHPLEILLNDYFAVSPEQFTDDMGVIDWDALNDKRIQIENSVPPAYQAEWERTLQSVLPPLTALERQLSKTVLSVYWDCKARVLAGMSPGDQATIRTALHSSDPNTRAKLQKSTVFKAYQRRISEMRQGMRKSFPEIDYYLWLFGYTTKVPKLFAIWGYNPPSIPSPDEWASTYKAAAQKKLEEAAKARGVSQYLQTPP